MRPARTMAVPSPSQACPRPRVAPPRAPPTHTANAQLANPSSARRWRAASCARLRVGLPSCTRMATCIATSSRQTSCCALLRHHGARRVLLACPAAARPLPGRCAWPSHRCHVGHSCDVLNSVHVCAGMASCTLRWLTSGLPSFTNRFAWGGGSLKGSVARCMPFSALDCTEASPRLALVAHRWICVPTADGSPRAWRRFH